MQDDWSIEHTGSEARFEVPPTQHGALATMRLLDAIRDMLDDASVDVVAVVLAPDETSRNVASVLLAAGPIARAAGKVLRFE